MADGKRIVLFFDEFQELASARRPYGDADAVTNRMRAIFQRSTAVSYLAGSIEHVMRDLFAPSRRAFSGFGSFYSLRQIEAEEWRAGLAARFREDDCTIADLALARIVELGGGHPRATMRIAQQTYLVSLELTTREIGLELVQLGFERALEGDRPTMEQIVERIRLLHKHGLLLARTVAGGNPMPRRVQPGARDRALKLLRDAGVLEHEGHGRWRVIDPLLRHYLAALTRWAEPAGRLFGGEAAEHSLAVVRAARSRRSRRAYSPGFCLQLAAGRCPRRAVRTRSPRSCRRTSRHRRRARRGSHRRSWPRPRPSAWRWRSCGPGKPSLENDSEYLPASRLVGTPWNAKSTAVTSREPAVPAARRDRGIRAERHRDHSERGAFVSLCFRRALPSSPGTPSARMRRPSHPPAAHSKRSRSLARLILPLGVFGSSGAKSTMRGYL